MKKKVPLAENKTFTNRKNQEVQKRKNKRSSKTSRKRSKSVLSRKKKTTKSTKNNNKNFNSSTIQKTLRKTYNNTKNDLPVKYNEKLCKSLDSHMPVYQSFYNGMIAQINNNNQLVLLNAGMQTQGEIYSLCLSHDNSLLASCNTIGDISIWDLETYQLLQRCRDEKEEEIFEFLTLSFSLNDRYIFAGGKRKNRKVWSVEDDDNAILPCPIKIFDILENQCVGTLSKHTEEVLCVVPFIFKNSNYLLSGGQDGSIVKWFIKKDWSASTKLEKMEDEISCMIFAIQFVPRSGNKYFIAACDHSLKIFDLESRKEIAKFDDLYSCYCDDVLPVVCPSFINFPQEESRLCTCYLLTRGVEDVNEDGLAIEANKVILHKLLPPEEPNGDWALLTERIFEDEHYYANSYLCRLATNGLYVAAPTVTGSVFIWNLLSGLKTAVIKEPNAAEREVRDILFHPSRNLLFITGDDGIIRVYKSESL